MRDRLFAHLDHDTALSVGVSVSELMQVAFGARGLSPQAWNILARRMRIIT